jgi:4-hydroxy-tetrahydrodipicolinate synthase
LSVNYEFFGQHCKWLVENGCSGVVALGSLGEGATLTFEEKQAVLKTAVAALGDNAPVVAGVSALSTSEAVDIAKMAADVGCSGLMVLPPYVYVGDWREMKAHVSAVVGATGLSCMLYNNPIAYGTDVTPEQVAELAAACANLHAVKESSADVRRITAIRSLLGDQLALLVGVDDLIVECVAAGATGWIAGLVNAFPRESVELFNLAMAEKHQEAAVLYKWFLPLLRMDVVPEFVHLIKLVQKEVGMGSERVRPPRLVLTGEKRAAALRVLAEAMKTRPKPAK